MLIGFSIDEAEPVTIMGSPGGRREVQNELLEAAGNPAAARVDEVDRHEFYALAEAAPVVIQTGELRGFANLLVRKGGLAR